MNRRIIKSQNESSGTETILLQSHQNVKSSLEIKTLPHPFINRRPGPEDVQKSLKKSQSTELIKVLTEKNLEIKKLQEENFQLSSQVSQLVGTVKKYKKLKSLIKIKNQTIESMRKSSLRSRGSSSRLNNEESKNSKNLSRKEKQRKSGSRLSIESETGSMDQFIIRPMTAANARVNFADGRLKSEAKLDGFQKVFRETFLKTEKVLKTWKNLYNGK